MRYFFYFLLYLSLKYILVRVLLLYELLSVKRREKNKIKKHMGVVDHFSHYFDCSHGRSKLKKRKQLQVSGVTYAFFFFFFFGLMVQVFNCLGTLEMLGKCLFTSRSMQA